MTSTITDKPTPTSFDSATDSASGEVHSSARRLLRSRDDRYLGGVCGGIAEHTGVDANVIRLFAVLATILGAGALVIVYAVAWIMLPEA
jgi:phage shock protein C